MHISKLVVHSVRNISQLEISPHPHFNIIVGENGSGKSSILEAIHLLGFGRSFRKSKSAELIQFGQCSFTVFADCFQHSQYSTEHLASNIKFGLSKNQSGESEVHIQGKKASRLSELSSQFPIVAFTCDSFELIDGSPSVRRKFLDWLVFHVKHDENVSSIYRDYARVLEQRNSALRHGLVEQTRSWDNAFIQLNGQIQQLRTEAVDRLNQEIGKYQNLLTHQYPTTEDQFGIKLEYKAGWNQQVDLAKLLEKNLQTDLKRKTTGVGVHRDELVLKFNDQLIKNVLSRGECKRYVLALMFAAEEVIKKQTDKNCIWIVDDIAAELDLASIQAAFNTNKNNKNQMFFTCIEKDLAFIQQVVDFEHAVFHVKHGKLIN